jgi:3-hydroxyisobutyrate dehydrogenase
LGLGAMGARMAARLVNEHIELKVWSRSGCPQGFPSLNPHLVPTAAAAVADAEIVIAMVTDDDASRAVWLESGALRGMRRGSLAVECSTLTPGWVGKLAQQALSRGVTFVDAPVIGSRPQADAGSLIFLAGGEASSLESLRPTLLRMGSEIHRLGASPAGAQAKLLANALFATQVATIAEIVGTARRQQLDLPALARAFEGLPVMSPSAKSAMTGMLAGAFAPLFPLRLAAKDLRYAVAEARAAQSDMPMTQAASELFERGIGRGFSEQNLTAVVRLYSAER